MPKPCRSSRLSGTATGSSASASRGPAGWWTSLSSSWHSSSSTALSCGETAASSRRCMWVCCAVLTCSLCGCTGASCYADIDWPVSMLSSTVCSDNLWQAACCCCGSKLDLLIMTCASVNHVGHWEYSVRLDVMQCSTFATCKPQICQAAISTLCSSQLQLLHAEQHLKEQMTSTKDCTNCACHSHVKCNCATQG